MLETAFSAHSWAMMGWASLAILGLMLVVTAIANPLKNAGIVDVAWAFGFTLIAGTYSVLGTGLPLRKTLIAGVMIMSSLRLASHLLKRVIATHPNEDARYHELREQWGPEKSPLYFFGVFIFQGLLMLIVSSPVAAVVDNAQAVIQPVEWVGLMIWAVGVLFETIADQQLSAFKKNPDNHGKICQTGLWAYSRHPNYFFEWLQWIGYFLFALVVPGGWLTVYSPLIMLFFLTKMTGVAITEAQTLKTKGEAYRRYQETTSAFIPWFPKTKLSGFKPKH